MDLVHKDLGIFHGPHCHHDRIISGDTSHHFGEFQGIQCRRHCHGHAGYGLDHQNILVIKTVSGMAMAVAAALDALKFSEVVGCIAGDDTIMVAVRTVEDTQILMDKIHLMIER